MGLITWEVPSHSAFSSIAEGFSFLRKSFVSSNPRGLSSLNGGESVITFKISATSTAVGNGGVLSVVRRPSVQWRVFGQAFAS